MNDANFSVVILAAGQGTRMRSDRHKVLHPIADKPMLLHLLDTVDGLGAARRVVVVGKGREQIEAAVEGRGVTTAIQAEQKGTAHAVLMAREALAGAAGPVLVLSGDTPFVTAETLQRMLERRAAPDRPGVVVLASSPDDAKR
jgi:bifunctional UDP-N-acetylglucosamine pyrophosphorylase/glucosamine-1-phosphate N-acetyltransferase